MNNVLLSANVLTYTMVLDEYNNVKSCCKVLKNYLKLVLLCTGWFQEFRYRT